MKSTEQIIIDMRGRLAEVASQRQDLARQERALRRAIADLNGGKAPRIKHQPPKRRLAHKKTGRGPGGLTILQAVLDALKNGPATTQALSRYTRKAMGRRLKQQATIKALSTHKAAGRVMRCTDAEGRKAGKWELARGQMKLEAPK